MDCEKFEASLMDELYGELDELTLAASKRHAAGCARCAALLSGFRATRKLASLPVLSPSAGFEDRILTAVREAEAKPKRGPAHFISWAGRWAMRPQTAMAAVFLLMVGVSSVLVTGRSSSPAMAPTSSNFYASDNGSPAAPSAAAAPAPLPSIDPRTAAAAHGTPLPPAPAAAAPAMGKGGPAYDMPPQEAFGGAVADQPSTRAAPKSMHAPARIGGGGSAGGYGRTEESRGGFGDLKKNDNSLQLDDKDTSPQFAPPPPPPPSDPYAAAQQQYRHGDYSGATQSFDGLAAQGDQTSALWAARSVRDGAGGCAVAADRFDRVANAAWGSPTGYDATLEGAQCYARIGQIDAARSRYDRLLTVPAYAARAQAGVNAISQVATSKARAAPVGKSAAKPAAAQAPAAPPATPAQAAPATTQDPK